MRIRCYYCKKKFAVDDNHVRHFVSSHPDDELVILVGEDDVESLDRTHKYRIVHFGVQGNELRQGDAEFVLNEDTMSLEVVSAAKCPVLVSPCAKVSKKNTPMKDVHSRRSLFTDTIESNMDVDSCDPGNETSAILDEITGLLPGILNHLKGSDRFPDWMSFLRQLASGTFPLNNVSFQLFLDVVRFLESEGATSMRYTPEVKQFWAVGYRLFHSKFIRFMGGPKCAGFQDWESVATKDARINFVCPSLKTLRTELNSSESECNKPGIIGENIDHYKSAATNDVSYKICMDGKKIAMGFGTQLGEVDLFGHEASPNLDERRKRLELEKGIIGKMSECFDNLDDADVMWLDGSTGKSNDLCKYSKDVTCFLGRRLQKLRELKVKKQLVFDRLIKETGASNWRQSKFVFAISAVKTFLHRIQASVDNLLDAIDGVSEIHAVCSGNGDIFCRGKNVDLATQKNYVCLYGYPSESEYRSNIPLHLLSQNVVQKTDEWMDLRKRAKVTGSTMWRALGLSTLKEQKEHYDYVVSNKPKPEFSAHQMECMEHGLRNEINAVATIVGKVLPALRPEIHFNEEGCYIEYLDGDVFMVVSPDGSGRTSLGTNLAFEIKCPMPGKKYVTDVHYTVPSYYVSQLLAEMKALGCNELFYVCYTADSTTVSLARFDSELWDSMSSYAKQLYGQTSGSRPTKKSDETKKLKNAISAYISNNVSFVGEFPSCVAARCKCTPDTLKPAKARGTHIDKSTLNSNTIRVEAARSRVDRAMSALCEAYDLTRTPAKEVLVFMLSDMDRIKKHNDIPHAVPVAYGLSGYSLTMDSIRSALKSVLEACESRGLHVVATSSDGQFYNLSVRSADCKPLTLLQVARDTWDEAKKATKAVQVKELGGVNRPSQLHDWDDIVNNLDCHVSVTFCERGRIFNGPIIVNGLKNVVWNQLYTPIRLSGMISKHKQDSSEDISAEAEVEHEDHILHLLPQEIQETLDEQMLDKIRCINKLIADTNDNNQRPDRSPDHPLDLSDSFLSDSRIADRALPSRIDDDGIPNESDNRVKSAPHVDGHFNGDNRGPSDNVFLRILDILRLGKGNKCKHNKWQDTTLEQVKEIFGDSKTINTRLTKPDLQECLLVVSGKLMNIGSLKTELVNALCDAIGITGVDSAKSPPSLRKIIKDLLTRKYSKAATNAIYAVNNFSTKVDKWRMANTGSFDWTVSIEGVTEPYVFYSFPEQIKDLGHEVVYMLDCHHLFVNMRCFICRKGIPERGIHKEAWLQVARSGRTSLNPAIVEDVIDAQSNAVAQSVFSSDVEMVLMEYGRNEEAKFCKLMREWYAAEDNPGISALERTYCRLELRKWLLDGVNFSDFPPPGMYVGGITKVLFEGILTNIGRRLQLHELCKTGKYNVRAPTSLDSENFFAEFQSIDPKGSGVLAPDDIPQALGTAAYILKARVDPERTFHMQTSKRQRVYEAHSVTQRPDDDSHIAQANDLKQRDGRKMDSIALKDHFFDDPMRVKKKPNRKNAALSHIDKPFKGVCGVREHHRKDESKILPHKMFNLQL